MINQVQLVNYQSHKETTIEFSEGITAICGESDKGKTGIFRGLYWAMYNRGSGLADVSDWCWTPKGSIKAGEVSSVSLKLGDGVLERKRTSDFNGFMSGEDKWEALRTDVPVPVSQILKMGDINVQEQMDPPFLISYSPPEASRYLNRLVGLEEIDILNSKINSKQLNTKRELDQEILKLEEKEVELKKLSWVHAPQGISSMIGSMQLMESEISGLEAQIKVLSSSLQNYSSSTEILNKVSPVVEKSNELLGSLSSDHSSLLEQCKIINSLSSSIGNWTQSESTITKFSGAIDITQKKVEVMSLDQESIQNSSTDLVALQRSIQEWKATIQDMRKGIKLEELSKLINTLEALGAEIKPHKEKFAHLSSSTVEYEKMVDSEAHNGLTIMTLNEQMPDTCPLCGNALTPQGDSCEA